MTQPGEPPLPVKARTGVTHSDVSRLRTGDSATMLGVAAPVQTRPAAPAAGGPPAVPPRPQSNSLKKTMVGGVANSADLPSMPRPAPPRPKSQPDADLPQARPPARPPGRPAPLPPRPASAAQKPGPDTSFDHSIELSSVPPEVDELDLPASRPPRAPAPAEDKHSELELGSALGVADDDEEGLPASLGGLDSILPASLKASDSNKPKLGANPAGKAPATTKANPVASAQKANAPTKTLDPPATAAGSSTANRPLLGRSVETELQLDSIAPSLGAGPSVRTKAVPAPASADSPELPVPMEPEPAQSTSVIPLEEVELGSLPPSLGEVESPLQASARQDFGIDDAIELPSPAADFDKDLVGFETTRDHGDFGFREPLSGPPPAFTTPTPAAEPLPDLPDLEVARPARKPAAASKPVGGSGEQSIDDDRFALDSIPPSQLGADSPVSRSDTPRSMAERNSGRGVGVANPGLGGTSYGELDLGGDGPLAEFSAEGPGATSIDEGEEFGAIPQEKTTRAEAAVSLDEPPAPRAAETAQVRDPIERRPAPAPASAGGSKSRKWIVVSILGATVALSSLALLPDVGPFGATAIWDLVHRSQYASALTDTERNLIDVQRADTYSELGPALDLVQRARAAAPRYKPLLAEAAFAHYALVVRFGGSGEVQAAGKVLLDALLQSDPDPELPYLHAARAAEAVVRRDFEVAERELGKSDRSSPEIQALAAEFALSRADAAGAKLAWAEAAAANPSAWTQYGLVRALLLAGELDPAEQAADQVLVLNPKHFGAKLAKLEVAVRRGAEARALEWGTKVSSELTEASPLEIVKLHTLLGQVHLQKGRLSRSEAEFAQALQLDPRNFDALLGMAETNLKAGRVAAALGGFEAAKSAPNATAKASLGIVECQLALERIEKARAELMPLAQASPQAPLVMYWQGRIASASGEREQAERAYRAVVDSGSTEPVVVDAAVALAEGHASAGQFDDAAKELSAVQARFPRSLPLLNAVGRVALSQGRYEDALTQFNAAQKLDPADVTSLFNSGSALRRLRRFDEAWAVFQQVGKLDAELPGLALERGQLLEQSGKAAEALHEYESALAKSPKDLDLMQRVGCGRVGAGNGKEAQTVLEEVLQKRPRSSEALHCLGRALFLQGRNLEALKRLQQAVDIDPNRAEYHMYLGWVANEAGQVATAKQALSTALDLDHGLGDAYWQRGVLNLRQGGPADAILDFKKALELTPSRFEAYADLAQAESQLGRTKDALAHWQRAVEADGNNPTWLFRYGKLLSSQHQNAEAAVRLEKALSLAAKENPPPVWAWEAHRLAALSLGESERALPHWRQFLELSPPDSPYREDARRALQRAGQN
ncbi:MAG TPA: tetratricopeptide repeat protein [Polyangiaceae bacterium]|nr:tetratricopeptide repeat protein [Polyangiaceae bacterium]